MATENFRKTRHKYPKFKDAYDENLDWHDRQEIKNLRRKDNKRSLNKRNAVDKW